MLKYYYDLMSQPSRALFIFLNKTKINYLKCPVALRKGEHKTEEYGNINPFMAVPAIDDDGFKLSESVAILRYLNKKYESEIPSHWYPKDAKDQAKIDEYMEWQHLNTRANCAMFFQYKLLIPLMTQTPPNEKKIAEFKRKMETTLDQFENIWLKDNQYIGGNKLSIADLLAICELQQPQMVGYDVRTNHPKLASWFDKVKAELQPEFDEASTIVEKVAKMYEGGLIQLPSAKL